MNAEFNWWLLIVGLVIGAAVVYLVLADSSRRDTDVSTEELPLEAAWIAATLRSEGMPADPRTVERALELHRLYLTAPPPDDVPEADEHADAARHLAGGDTAAHADPATPEPSVRRHPPHVEGH
jgi:hypothetical protein